MPIPEFDQHGNLPEGRHPASVEEIERRLVIDFEGSRTRRAIFSWWREHAEALASLVAIEAQWLAGSFVTDKPDPNDVDIVAVLSGPDYDALPRHQRLLVTSLVRGNYTEKFWRTDTWPVFEYPEDHPGRDAAFRARRWFEQHFSRDREGRTRGLVTVQS